MKELPAEMTGFELSRIYGQGWNAAKKLLASGKSEVDAPYVAARSPYRSPEQQARWIKGFMEAFESRAGPFATPGRSSWRRTVAKGVSVDQRAQE